MALKLNKDNYIKYTNELSDKFSNLEILFTDVEDYFLYNKQSIECFCKICGEFNQKSYDNMLKNGCWRCKNIGDVLYQSYKTFKNIDIQNTITWANNINTNKDYEVVDIIYNDYIHDKIEYIKDYSYIRSRMFKYIKGSGCGYDLKIKCKIHDYEWITAPHKFLKGKGNCHLCNEPSGEMKIRLYLESKNIKYQKEYMFLDLKGIGGNNLRFDFATFDNKDNLLCLIEFQGKQHYEPIDYFGGIDKFNKQVEHDNIKKKYCKNKGINLIEISYKDFDDVEKILNKKDFLCITI